VGAHRREGVGLGKGAIRERKGWGEQTRRGGGVQESEKCECGEKESEIECGLLTQ
jgi:hypothetical protein